MKSADFRRRLEQAILVCAGARGSQLYELLGPMRCFEETNLQHAEAVLRIHLAYIQAGARLIETNTFGANRAKLAALGLADRVAAFNQSAVKIAREAREAAGVDVLIAGSIGPLGPAWQGAGPAAPPAPRAPAPPPGPTRARAKAVKELPPKTAPARKERRAESVAVAAPPPPAPKAAEPVSTFYRKLEEGKFVVSVEIDPPKGVNLDRILESVSRFKSSGRVDAVDINSGALARVGMDAIMLAGAIEQAGMETIPHLTTRDLNIIGLQAILLGAWSVGGVRNVLAITGDPPVLGDHPEVSGIYEVDAVGLVRILSRLNQGHDWAGKTLGGGTNFAIGVAVNPTADDLDEELRRFEQKVGPGPHFAMTQPIFDPAIWDDFLKRLGGQPPIPTLVGLWPLSGPQLAVRLNNEVPGIRVPEHVIKRLEAAGPRARDVGFEIARELLAWARSTPTLRGAYLIPPFKKYEEALDVLTA